MSRKLGNIIEELLDARIIIYGRAVVPVSVDENLQVKWHLPGGGVTASEKHALAIAQRMHLLMGGRKNPRKA